MHRVRWRAVDSLRREVWRMWRTGSSTRFVLLWNFLSFSIFSTILSPLSIVFKSFLLRSGSFTRYGSQQSCLPLSRKLQQILVMLRTGNCWKNIWFATLFSLLMLLRITQSLNRDADPSILLNPAPNPSLGFCSFPQIDNFYWYQKLPYLLFHRSCTGTVRIYWDLQKGHKGSRKSLQPSRELIKT